MVELVAIAILASMNLVQMYLLVRLVDRVMSRNYYDFKVSEQVNVAPKKGEIKVPANPDDFEDLGYLSGI